MGCGGSKLEELEAVALCRDRGRLLADAIRYRYALADAHAAYASSLRSAGASLHRFLDALRSLPPPGGDVSPLLALPTHRKGDPLPPFAAAADTSAAVRDSHSGSHIEFHSSDEDSDDDDDDGDYHLHSTGSSPLDLHHDAGDDVGPTFVNHNFSRNRPSAASVSYEQRPESPETVQVDPSPPYGYSYPTQNPNFYPYPDPYSYASYGGMGGFFGSASPPRYAPVPPGGGAGSPSSSRAPPPPPSPPKASTWDFLNPFETYENNGYYTAYTPSRSSRELREEEGIPDLEDEEHDGAKESYSKRKSAASSSASASASGAAAEEFHKVATAKEEEIAGASGDPLYKPKSSVEVPKRSAEASTSVDYDAHVVEKNVVTDEVKVQEQQQQQLNLGAVAAPRRYNGLSDIMTEIKSQFDKASESFNELSKMLEVGKIPYHQKNSVYEVSTKMICGVASPSTSKDVFLEFEEERVIGSRNLSSTLQKLYMWEKKLYDEVKVEEKMRVVLERECEHLRHLDERGAEAHKLDATQIFIRKLSTKIRISIQVVESISNKISTLRDEELWPQIIELIQGLMRMWRVMLECHRTQCQAISEATIASDGRLTEVHMDATKQLELELLDLIASFTVWISTQKSFVKALNGWLLKGLRYVHEETADGVAPFSPGRLGAPPVFVICNYWSQTIDRISEREVVEAMQAFASNVLGLWEQHNSEKRQRLMANSDMDRNLKIIEREEQRMRRTVEERSKKLVLVSGHSGLTLSHHVEPGSLQLNLRQIFKAMEDFTRASVKEYEELLVRSEEEKSVNENTKVP